MITKLNCQEEMEYASESYVNDTNITEDLAIDRTSCALIANPSGCRASY